MSGKSERPFLNKGTEQKRSKLKSAVTFLAQLVAAGLIVLPTAYGVHYAYHQPAASLHFGLEQIEYQGLIHLERERLDPLILGSLPKNVLLVDLDQLRKLVETESWVREARVRRKLPNRLLVSISERRPAAIAAIDNELYVVDAEGMVLDPHGPRYHSINHPIVKGLRNVARENAREDNAQRMQIYLRVLAELGDSGEDYSQLISEIDVENPERVAVIPDGDPIHIYLGNSNFLIRYQTFLSQKDLYDRLKEQYGLIESVDVTYDNKIIFHTPQEKEEGTAPPPSGEQS